MNPNYRTRLHSLKLLSDHEVAQLSRVADETDALERVWERRFGAHISTLDALVFEQLRRFGRIVDPSVIDFESLVLEHSIDTIRFGMSAAGSPQSPETRKVVYFAKPPNVLIPHSFADLRDLWDKWRRKKEIPERQRFVAEKIRKAYLLRCQRIWRKHSEEFLEGQVFNQRKVEAVLAREGDMARARADMVVRTETTYYFNRGRKIVYDRSSDVGGYLFMCIRDQATTKWCKTRYRLVYLKGDKLLLLETPPIHWNCRSELLPLLWSNPRHRAWLENPAMLRSNHTCEPLPAGWAAR